MVPEELQKRLRQGKVNREDRINLALETGKSLMPAMFSSYGVSNGKARAFMHKKPMIYRYLLLNALRGLSWMEKGGSDSFPPTAATNEEIDNHYILSATAFHGLLTEEKSMNSAYQDLLQMLRK